MASVNLKKNYRCIRSLQQFYSGGPYALSSDGSFLICACDEKINVVDSSNASIRSTLEGDSESVTALALSPDDKFLFSASHSRLIRVWDLSSSKCLRSWKAHEGPVMRMASDSTGGLLVSGGSDRKVLVWDVEGGFCTHYFKGHKGVVTSLMFHPDANRLLLFSGSDDATVRVWDLVSKKCMAVLEEHFSTVTSLAVSENGWTLLSSGRDKVVILWDLRNYSSIMTVPTNEVIENVCVICNGTGMSACLGPLELHNGKKKRTESPPICFLTTGERGVVRMWNSESKICAYEKQSSDTTISSDEESEKWGLTSAAILPSDQGLLCVTADQQFLFYSPTQSAEGSFQLTLNKRLVGYNEEIVDLKFLGEEENFLAVATNVEQVRVYELATMSCSYVLAGHTDIVLCLDTCVSSSGRTLIVTGSKDNNVRLWEDKSRSCIGLGIGHMGAVGAVAFSKKQKNFFVSGSSDRTIKVWSLDGLSEDCNEVINLKAKAVVAAHDKDINSLAVAPNDNYVCSGSQDRTACIWRLPDLVRVVVLRGHKKGIWSVEFSPVDQCVITSSGDKTIKIWAISDGSCLKTFEGHTSSVLRASFLTRGAQVVSSGSDGLVKLWTVKTNECIATYDQHESQVWALAVGKQTEMLASGGRDAVVNIWHDCTAADKEEAFRKEEEGVLKGQQLENAVSDSDYSKAIQLAFELRRPHRLFELFAGLCRNSHVEQIEKALCALGREEIRVMLEYIREWNTKPKLCYVAQIVLFEIFNILPPTEIIEIKGIAELLEGLIPYTQRHFTRIDRLIRGTFLLDYTLTGMSVLEPEPDISVPKDDLMLRSDENGQAGNLPPSEENAIEEQARGSTEMEGDEKVYSRKRKSSKSEGSNKKLKAGVVTDATGILSRA